MLLMDPKDKEEQGSPPDHDAGRVPGVDAIEMAGQERVLDAKEAIAAFDLDEEYPEFSGWDSLGFQRPLGQELWQVVLEQVQNALYIFIMMYLIPIIMPFPEIIGINNLAAGLYAIFYIIFDTGTNFGIHRFIAEYRIKRPERMLMYVSFFIKYQMLTGLVQVTLLSWYTFGVIVHSNYAYLAWVLLLLLQKQWPGMLGIFKTVLSGLQHHAKVEMMNFAQGQVVERLTMIGFVLFGRWLGEQNPALGILMGIVIFTQIGNYVDDILFGIISGWYVNRILKRTMNISLKDLFKVKIEREVYKEMIFYGVQGSLLPILGTAVGTFLLVKQSSTISGYVAFTALINFGGMFSGIVGQYGDFALGVSIAESYSNKKLQLAQFYIAYKMRWRFFFKLLVSMAVLSVLPYFIYIIDIPGGPLQYYAGAIPYFIPLLFKRLIDPFFDLPGTIMYGAQHITANNIFSAIQTVLHLIITIILMDVFFLHEMGYVGLLVLLGFGLWPAQAPVLVLRWFYVNRRIVQIRINKKATFLGPLISASPVIGFTQAWWYTGFFPMVNAIGLEVTITLSMLLLTVILLFVYFPLNVIVGGWDDYMFFTFKKAVDLSGPSKPFFLLIYKIMERFRVASIKIGTWNKKGWSIPYEAAHREIIELNEWRRANLSENR